MQGNYIYETCENNKDMSVCRALNTFTKGTNSRQKEVRHHFTTDAFNDYFLSIAETLVKSHYSLLTYSAYSALLLLKTPC